MVLSLKFSRLHLRKKNYDTTTTTTTTTTTNNNNNNNNNNNDKYIKEKPKTTFLFRIQIYRGRRSSTLETWVLMPSLSKPVYFI